MLLSDIYEIKTLLEIPLSNTTEDLSLNFLIEMASSWIEEYLNRGDLAFQSRTEYYNGTGTRQLLLRSRPVFTTPTIQVFKEYNGYYGAVSGSFGTLTELTYGTEFVLKIDQPNGTSRSGILIKRDGVWPEAPTRSQGLLTPYFGPSYGSIKVIYSAGYTVDMLPTQLRYACGLVVARMRNLFPLGRELASESYEDRQISYRGNLYSKKDSILSLAYPILDSFRNRKI